MLAEKPKSKQKTKKQLTMKKTFMILGLLGVLAFSTISSAQDRPMRIGLKFGWPQIAGLNLEYVTPLAAKKLAADLDLSYFSFSVNEATVSYTHIAFGANYYFMNEGKGLYGGLGISRMGFGATETVTSTDEATFGQTSTGEASLGLYSLNLKVGGKHGGLFYFRWELGYRIGLNSADIKVKGTFPGGYTQEETISNPVGAGGILADVGFGFSF